MTRSFSLATPTFSSSKEFEKYVPGAAKLIIALQSRYFMDSILGADRQDELECWYCHLDVLGLLVRRWLSQKQIEKLHDAALRFVTQYYALYGAESANTKLHALLHVADHVRQHGPLPHYSSFVFESVIRQVKGKMVNMNHKDLSNQQLTRFWFNRVLQLFVTPTSDKILGPRLNFADLRPELQHAVREKYPSPPPNFSESVLTKNGEEVSILDFIVHNDCLAQVTTIIKSLILVYLAVPTTPFDPNRPIYRKGTRFIIVDVEKEHIIRGLVDRQHSTILWLNYGKDEVQCCGNRVLASGSYLEIRGFTNFSSMTKLANKYPISTRL